MSYSLKCILMEAPEVVAYICNERIIANVTTSYQLRFYIEVVITKLCVRKHVESDVGLME